MSFEKEKQYRTSHQYPLFRSVNTLELIRVKLSRIELRSI